MKALLRPRPHRPRLLARRATSGRAGRPSSRVGCFANLGRVDPGARNLALREPRRQRALAAAGTARRRRASRVRAAACRAACASERLSRAPRRAATAFPAAGPSAVWSAAVGLPRARALRARPRLTREVARARRRGERGTASSATARGALTDGEQESAQTRRSSGGPSARARPPARARGGRTAAARSSVGRAFARARARPRTVGAVHARRAFQNGRARARLLEKSSREPTALARRRGPCQPSPIGPAECARRRGRLEGRDERGRPRGRRLGPGGVTRRAAARAAWKSASSPGTRAVPRAQPRTPRSLAAEHAWRLADGARVAATDALGERGRACGAPNTTQVERTPLRGEKGQAAHP